MNVVELLRGAADRFAEETALIGRERAISYADLNRSCQGIARSLLREGVQPGDRVMVQGATTIETAQILLACFHAGIIAMPVNIRLKPAEIAYVLDHARPSLCFCEPALLATLEAARALVADPPPVRTAIPEPIDGPDLPIPPDDAPALVMYTSGTTAHPKGVTHSFRTLGALAPTWGGALLVESAVAVVPVPLMHASGLTCVLIPGLTIGATMVLIPAWNPPAILDAIERHRCAWGLGLPAMMPALLDEQEMRPRDVTSLDAWLCGGDAVPLALQERFQRVMGAPLYEGYAMTESLIICRTGPDRACPGSFGRPAATVQLRVQDFDGNPVPDGTVGEVAVRSGSNFVGYWNDPAATSAALVDGWLLTGDLARRDADGFFWFAGRRKEIIIRCGSNIAPQEVEEAIYLHPAVLEVGVIGRRDEAVGERVVAFVSLREGHSATAEELQAFARERLADYKVPEQILFLPALPKGPSGKVQRRALKELSQAAGAD